LQQKITPTEFNPYARNPDPANLHRKRFYPEFGNYCVVLLVNLQAED
jgi:hypothetical protein